MATLAAAPPWIPEDDLLLKNAVEGGASLEALSKGAVRFSRKFTVAELRDRWHSLLYDPIVSAEASARMLESEPAKKSASGNKSSEVAPKRKSESIRKLYYGMRKRICKDPSLLELSDIKNYLVDHNFQEESNQNGYGRGDSCNEQAQVFSLKQSARQCEASAHQNNAYNEFTGGTCGDLKFPSLHSARPLWKHIEDNSPTGVAMIASLEDKVQVVGQVTIPRKSMDCTKYSLTKYNSLHVEKMLPDEHIGDQIAESAATAEKDLMDMSDCLLNFGNEDELHAVDVDGKAVTNVGPEVKDEKSSVSTDSRVLNRSDDKQEHNGPIPDDAWTMEGTTRLASQSSASAEKLDVAAAQLDPSHSDQLQGSCLETDEPSSVTRSSNCNHVEMSEEAIICTLNSEDPEIPCNDDIPSPSALFSAAVQKSHNGSSSVAFTSSNEEKKVEEQKVLKKEENKPGSVSVVHQIMETRGQATACSNYHLVKDGGNFEVSSGQRAGVVLKESRDVQTVMDPCRLVDESPGFVKDPSLVNKSSVTDSPTKAAENSSTCNIPELDGSSSGIDYEQDESDLHIPNYDDIEAMILDMDLWPKDCESYASKEVSRYKSEDARRAILRAEQCAQSSIQRAIGSRGALAVLYGRHSKHYIRKAEVILGRSTHDFNVDIDLVGEGGTNRISRRQALIKLETDGSFSLKNLGKNPMFLNGKEVCQGQFVRLIPSCVIEVKGIAFIFEMNEKSVRQYLGKVAQESRRENNSFKWSPEGVP